MGVRRREETRIVLKRGGKISQPRNPGGEGDKPKDYFIGSSFESLLNVEGQDVEKLEEVSQIICSNPRLLSEDTEAQGQELTHQDHKGIYRANPFSLVRKATPCVACLFLLNSECTEHFKTSQKKK